MFDLTAYASICCTHWSLNPVFCSDNWMFLMGLDMLSNHKCVVDLEKRCLRFGGQDGLEVPFLTEEQLPVRLKSSGGAKQPQYPQKYIHRRNDDCLQM